MQTTMNLLEQALAVAPIPTWTAKLKLSRDAIAMAKSRGKLSPVLAAGLATELGEEPTKWITLAALEIEVEQIHHSLSQKKLDSRQISRKHQTAIHDPDQKSKPAHNQ